MDRASILETIIRLVSETLEADPESITEETSFDDLDADSFDKLELVTAMEDEFDMTLDDEVLTSISTVGEAADAIEAASQN